MWSDQRESSEPVATDPRAGEGRPELSSARAAHAEFLARLVRETPRAWVVRLLVAANAAVYAWMIASGVDPLSPQTTQLIDWGANYGPRTTGGEWWRLFTCMFLHFGLVHIGFNMWVLASFGPLVERMLGHASFLVLYIAAGLLASLASLWWDPIAVSAGASGAIFGAVGGLLGVLALRAREMPRGFVHGLRRSLVEFVALNVLLGAIVPHIGLTAHLGGLAAGFLCGLFASRRGLFVDRRLRSKRALETALLALAVTVAGAFLSPRDLPDPIGSIEAFAAAEQASQEAYNRAIEDSKARAISDLQLAEILEQEVLPPWRAAREQLEGLSELRTGRSGMVPEILAYAALRQGAWEMQARALRSGDRSLLQKAAQEHDRADELARVSEERADP